MPDGEVESPAAVGDHSVAEVTGSDFAFAEPVPETPTHDFAFASDFGMAPEYMPAATKQEHLTPESFETAEFESTHPIADGETVEETAVPKLVEKDVSHELQSLESVSTVEPEIEKGLFAEPSIETSGAESETKFDEALVTEPAIVFDSPPADEAHDFESSPFDQTVAQFEPAGFSGGGHVPVATAPMVEAIASKPAGSRLSDRHVDLPIEVAEDERRLHNDARRFARLLVSEIKLYNEKKVQDGREASNLYEVLREAIDRSREMYDKRVQPPVASKFDYFHYELVNSLADGEESRLGSVYKGATV